MLKVRSRSALRLTHCCRPQSAGVVRRCSFCEAREDKECHQPRPSCDHPDLTSDKAQTCLLSQKPRGAVELSTAQGLLLCKARCSQRTPVQLAQSHNSSSCQVLACRRCLLVCLGLLACAVASSQPATPLLHKLQSTEQDRHLPAFSFCLSLAAAALASPAGSSAAAFCACSRPQVSLAAQSWQSTTALEQHAPWQQPEVGRTQPPVQLPWRPAWPRASPALRPAACKRTTAV